MISEASRPSEASFTRYPAFSSMRPTNFLTLMESSATTTTRSFSTGSTAAAGMFPAATASAPGANTRAAGEDEGRAWRSAVSFETNRFKSMSRIKLPSGAKCGPGKNFSPPQIISQVLDNDFVFAQNFFDHHAHLLAGYLYDDHVKIAVHRFERRKRQLQIEPDDFRDHIAHTREEPPAHVFNFRRL